MTGISVADFDSDVWPDIVATNIFWGQVSMLRSPNGSFAGLPLA